MPLRLAQLLTIFKIVKVIANCCISGLLFHFWSSTIFILIVLEGSHVLQLIVGMQKNGKKSLWS